MTEVAANAGVAREDYLGMSDEDFLNVNSPGAPAVVAPVEEEAVQLETAEPVTPITTEDQDDSGKTSEEGGAAVEEAGVADVVEKVSTDSTDETTPKVVAAADPKIDADKPAEVKEEAKAVDYEGFFKQIMTPFKANGRTFELKTPDEAIRLMQMGAGYGRKIQELQPHLKVLRMLEKNDLLDEGKLSFLIDVNQKNPDAIKKIIKDSGLDPLDLNIEDNVQYNPVNHAVSDKEVEFQTALKDVQEHTTGVRTLQVINQTWDQESKSLLWDKPELLGVIQSQRDNGVYDQIASEIERQKLLGQIPNSTPFLQAYKIAGDHLQATNGFKFSAEQTAQIQTQTEITPQPQVIATRSAAPKAQVQNGDKAAAASSTQVSTTRKATTTVNPLDIADDVFMKQYEGRF